MGCAEIVEVDFQLARLGEAGVTSKAWDAFVDGCSNGTFFHLSGWQAVIVQSYGHRCHYLAALKQQKIIGVLPLVEQKSRLFGHALISTPFCVVGGVASDDENAMVFLESAAMDLAEQLGVDYLELRYPFPRDNAKLTEKCAHSVFSTELAEDEEAILAKIKKKQRAAVRHSLKNDLSERIDQDVEAAYQIYSESVRNLGTPVFPKGYFHTLKQVFPEQTEVLTVEHQNKPVSSVLSFYYKDEVLPYYGGGIEQARGLKSNDFMYYRLMSHAQRNRGCQRFDFGRSKNDSGAYKYKHTWGMQPQPLHYQFYLVNAKELPNLSPNNPKYQLFIKLWQHFPLWLSRWLGPKLSRFLG